VEWEKHCERCKGVYQALPVVVWEAPKDWLTEHYCWGLRATVCVAASTLCVTERDNQEVQKTLASEEQYKREMQLNASGTRSGASRSRARWRRTCPSQWFFFFLCVPFCCITVGRNPKSNKACPKSAAGKNGAGPCAFLHWSAWCREG